MAGVNKVILVGNLGKDPEIKSFDSGSKVASFPIATSESYTDRTTGERKEQTEWHNISIWGGLADVAEKYLKKGSQVYIEGKLRTRSYEKDGDTRYITEIVGNNLTMLGKKGESNDGGYQPQSSPSPSVVSEPKAPEASTNTSFEAEADDLPF